VREDDGLARSSRNALLTDENRARAVCLSRGLFAARAAFAAGERSPQVLAGLVAAAVEEGGLALEYAAIRDPLRWTASDPEGPLERAVALVAARAGAVRLIDNLDLGEGEGA
jgi:pantoate--beta-alanine ligase